MKFFQKITLLILCCVSSFSVNAQTIKYYQSFDNQRIAYEDTGKGKPILLLHGFINTGQNWRRTQLYKNLIAKGFRVIVPDMRGNGKSDKPHEDKFYQNEAEVRDVIGLMASLKIKKYEVVGYSRGSIVAGKLLTMDKGITKVVLGGIGQHFTNPNWDRRIMFAEAFSGKAHLHPKPQEPLSTQNLLMLTRLL